MAQAKLMMRTAVNQWSSISHDTSVPFLCVCRLALPWNSLIH